jgi:hypothetical protein
LNVFIGLDFNDPSIEIGNQDVRALDVEEQVRLIKLFSILSIIIYF